MVAVTNHGPALPLSFPSAPPQPRRPALIIMTLNQMFDVFLWWRRVAFKVFPTVLDGFYSIYIWVFFFK